jgi:hypothetical protein
MTFPKIDLPGKWRWKDCYFTSDSRKVKVQQKSGLIWLTRADCIYWPNSSLGTQAQAIDSCQRKVIRFWNQRKPTEIHPA